MALAAQRFFDLRRARAGLFPFAFERGLLFFEALLFFAKFLGLQRDLLAGSLDRGALFDKGGVLLLQRIHALAGLRLFIGEARFEGFGACEALGHGGQFFAARDDLLLKPLEIAAEIGDGSGGCGALRFRCLAGTKRFGVLPAGVFGARAGRFGVGAEPGDLFTFGGELLVGALRFVARLVALVRGRDERFLRLHLLRSGGSDLRFGGCDLLVEMREFALLRRRRIDRGARLPSRAGEVRA